MAFLDAFFCKWHLKKSIFRNYNNKAFCKLWEVKQRIKILQQKRIASLKLGLARKETFRYHYVGQ